MASSFKTSKLGLNKWQSSDAPKMSDFNADNQKVDDALRTHFESPLVHMTDADRQKLKNPFSVGTYTGTGVSSQIIELGFKPSFLMVLCDSMSPFVFDFERGFTKIYYGVLSGEFASSGLYYTDTGFEVYYSGPTGGGDGGSYLNELNKTYCYLYLR